MAPPASIEASINKQLPFIDINPHVAVGMRGTIIRKYQGQVFYFV